MDLRPDGETIDVRVLCMEGCDATPPTERLILDVAVTLGVCISLERVAVNSDDDAAKMRFLGSPTVQVNGLDIEVDARSVHTFGLT